MKKSILLNVLFLAAIAGASSSAFALDETTPNVANDTWEITGGTNGAFTHTFGNGDHDAYNTYNILVGVSYFVAPQIELGFDGSFNLISRTGLTVSNTILAISPTYNFSKDIENSIYVKADVGLQLDHSDGVNTFDYFYYSIGVGKRIAVVTHVNWSPFIAFQGHTSDTTDLGFKSVSRTQLAIIPVQFSFTF